MRIPRLLAILPAALLGLAALAAVPSVAAQSGCTADAHCPLVVTVDDKTLGVSVDHFLVGTWYDVDYYNNADVNHTITLPDFGVSVMVPLDGSQTGTIQFSKTGCYAFKDSPSGATHQIRVLNGDPIDFSQSKSTESDPCAGANGAGSSSSSGKAPGFELPLLVVGLVAAMIVLRRRM